MIDTITIRIHNATQYNLYEYFNRPDIGVTHVTGAVQDGKIDTSLLSGIYYNDTDKFLVIRRMGRLYNPSSNYYIGVRCNPGDNFVDLEYSCPKWTYGHNVAQLIDYWEQDAAKCFQVLTRHLVSFFDRHIPAKIEDGDIEIRRIDLCYNQFHETKEDALSYIEHLKPGFSRLARSNGSVPVPYDTGIHFTTRRMSFKVYHKGTEFRKNDYYKLLENHKPGMDIEATAAAADRILRYEVTFRHSGLNYQFHQLYEKAVRPGADARRSIYRKMFYLAKVEKKSVNRSFCMKSEYNYLDVDQPIGEMQFRYHDLFIPNRVTFDRILFTALFDLTWKLIKKVSVTPSGDHKLFMEKIKQANYMTDQEAKARSVFSKHRKKPHKVNTRKILLWYKMSQKPGGLKLAMKKGFISERQYYNILKLFRRFGYDDYNPEARMMKPDFGYSEYKRIFGALH